MGWAAAEPIITFLRRKASMRSWRSKFIFLLIVYFAGFATAIYCLAPAPDGQNLRSGEKSFMNSLVKSDEFAQSFNSGLHKCIDFSRDAAWRAGRFIKQKLNEREADG